MAIWKEQAAPRKDPVPASPEFAVRKEPERPVDPMPSADMGHRPVQRETAESLIAANISIEGTISGSGHVRIAGRFKGDVNVEGNLTIESGARLNGGIRARSVVIAGEVEGNIDDAARVELLESAVLTGDLKAGSLTVAAGSRMRGHVEFGWEEKPQRPGLSLEKGAAS
jgi:cytoskeletal protein CcmA (bactofilin family)